jgi:cold-inducible RNA-binding protein
MNLFVARLDSSTTGDDLLNLFSVHGEVTSAKVIMDKETGNSKGYGFVEMPNDEEGNAAIAALNETEVDGKTIVVKEANPPQDRPKRDFNRGGGGGFNRGGGGFNRGGGGERRERTFRSDDRRPGGGGGERRERTFRSDDRRPGGGGGERRGGNGGGNRNFDRRGGGGGGFNRDYDERW